MPGRLHKSLHYHEGIWLSHKGNHIANMLNLAKRHSVQLSLAA